jgi:nicotinamide-nucleotide amidase
MSWERRAVVVATGDELIAGMTVDLNTSVIARELADIGWTVERAIVLGDDEEELAAVYNELAARYPVVISTGGLGPTLDDVTREAAARAARVPLELDNGSLGRIRAWFDGRGRTMAASNERQAMFPRGAEVMPNERGTAPGFVLPLQSAHLFVLPGPPREMSGMLVSEVVPRLLRSAVADGVLASHTFHLFGLSESAFADEAGPWMVRGSNPRMGVSAKLGILRIALRAQGETEPEAKALLDRRADEFRQRFGDYVFSEGEPSLAVVVGQELIAGGLQIATAESCTGGLVAGQLTDVPGISAVFRQGFVTYSDEAKVERLGVRAETLMTHGAVSEQTAGEMALGAARAAGARIAVSTTGVAGPGGGTEEKPVGLVWFATALDGDVRTASRRFGGLPREAVRSLSVHTALDLVRRRLAEDRGGLG